MAYPKDAPLNRQAGLDVGVLWTISRHQDIAAAAESHLTNTTQQAIAQITAPLGSGVSFSGLAGWADTVKRRPPAPNDDADTVAFLSDHRNDANDTWHYVDIPCLADSYDRVKYPQFTRNDDVVQMIAEAVRVFTAGSNRFSRLNALRLIIHLVGDVHQPIHVGCGYIDSSSTPAKLVLDPQVAASLHLPDDHGGNQILLPGNGNLHSYWDGKLGSVGVSDGDVGGDAAVASVPPDLKVQRLSDLVAAVSTVQDSSITAPNPDRWAEEWATKSLMAAREAYKTLSITGPSGHNFKVSWEGKQAYDARCTPIANERLASAVLNLAGLLNKILG